MPYNIFAGRVATRALSIGSLDEEDLNDNIEGVNEKAVAGQIKFYVSPPLSPTARAKRAQKRTSGSGA
jgi:hypothetical protein